MDKLNIMDEYMELYEGYYDEDKAELDEGYDYEDEVDESFYDPYLGCDWYE